MSIESLLEDYRALPSVTKEETVQFAKAIKFQSLHTSGDVIPMTLFLQGLGTRFTDEKGYAIYLNKVGMRTQFVPCLQPSYFKDFEGKLEAEKYPYVLWFKKGKINNG